jgi:hypothetical protein
MAAINPALPPPNTSTRLIIKPSEEVHGMNP